MIEREAQLLNGQPDKIYLGGCSQGAVIALATFMLYKGGRLGGCVSCFGAHRVALDYANEVDLALKRQTKVLLYHGEADTNIKITEAMKSYEEFTTHQLDVEIEREPDLGHRFSSQMIQRASDFYICLML